MRRLAAMLVVGIAACHSEPPQDRAAAGRPPAQAQTQADSQAQADSQDQADSQTQADSPATPAVTALTPEATARVAALTRAFAAGKCIPEGTAELRALQRAHGDPEPLRKAQELAFKVCDDAAGAAELLARTLPADPSASDELRLGAAWIRATRYEDAIAVLEPLAASEGPTSKAAWLAGFALFHAGRSEDARELLESARAHASKDRPDAWLMLGLIKLYAGDVEGATAELEAGTQAVPDSPSLWSALSRAYAAAQRPDDAQRASARARKAHAARAESERTTMRLAARSNVFKTAAKSGDVAEVERLFDAMWPDAPHEVRRQLLQARATVYDNAGRTDDAAKDRSRAQELAQAQRDSP